MKHTKVKMLTVKDLKDRLERLETAGYGDYELMFRDYDDLDWEVSSGIQDVNEKAKIVVLG